MSQEWTTSKNRRKYSSNIPRKLAEFFPEEDKDGRRHYSPRVSHEADYRTPPPLQQRNRYSPLYTDEDPDDEEDISPDGKQVREGSGKTRERSPLKPEKGQLATGTSASQLAPQPKPPQQPIHPPHPPTQPASDSSYIDPVMAIPATGLPMTQDFFRSFMMSFSKDIKKDIKGDIAEIRADMQALVGFVSKQCRETDQRFLRLENRVSEMTSVHNEMVDAHKDLIKENKWLREKLADIEDRNRRNNVRLRGVPESVSNADLKTYMVDLLKTTFPDLTENELTLDRIHRLPKPDHIPKHLPRDVIVRIHFYHVKEKLLNATRRNQKLPGDYRNLILFQDLSKATLQARREFSQVTTTLRYKNIDYIWGFPTKLIIDDNGTKHLARTPEEGKDLLHKWNIPIHIPRDPRKDRTFRPPISPKPAKYLSAPVAMDTTQPPPARDAAQALPEKDKADEATGTG